MGKHYFVDADCMILFTTSYYLMFNFYFLLAVDLAVVLYLIEATGKVVFLGLFGCLAYFLHRIKFL